MYTKCVGKRAGKITTDTLPSLKDWRLWCRVLFSLSVCTDWVRIIRSRSVEMEAACTSKQSTKQLQITRSWSQSGSCELFSGTKRTISRWPWSIHSQHSTSIPRAGNLPTGVCWSTLSQWHANQRLPYLFWTSYFEIIKFLYVLCVLMLECPVVWRTKQLNNFKIKYVINMLI